MINLVFLKGTSMQKQLNYNTYCIKYNRSNTYESADELLEAKYEMKQKCCDYLNKTFDSYEDSLINNLDAHTIFSSDYVCYDKNNKLNKLYSGYFSSYIIPPFGYKYSKQTYNNIKGQTSLETFYF